MADLLFTSSSGVLNNFVTKLRSQSSNTPFESERNGLILNILESIIEYSDLWDRNTTVTASYIGEGFIKRLIQGGEIYKTNGRWENDFLDDVFSSLYRFSLEMDLSAIGDIEFDIGKIKIFVTSNRPFFSVIAGSEIDYAQTSLPISILKGIVNTSDFRNLNEFVKILKDSKQERDDIISQHKAAGDRYKADAEKKEEDWKSYISEKQSEVDKIKKSLDSYETAFNFVGLYDGFKSLSDEKKTEKYWSLFFVVSLGVLVFVPLSWEMFTSSPERKFSNIYDALYFIPIFSVTFVLIYYFRVALQSYNSIKAQLSQIELRKTLCRFIQDYSHYSAKIKKNDSESLSKFESIIFSSIITNGDNIPSTFDGLENIVKLIGDLKK